MNYYIKSELHSNETHYTFNNDILHFDLYKSYINYI